MACYCRSFFLQCLRQETEIRALTAARRSPKDGDRVVVLSDPLANGPVERLAGRAVAIGNDEVLTNRLGTSLRNELDDMTTQNPSVRLRPVLEDRPLPHGVAECQPTKSIGVRRH